MSTITLNELSVGLDTAGLIDLNRALRHDLMTREYAAAATTEVNGGDRVAIVDDDGGPMTVAAVLTDIEAFLADDDER